MIELKLFIWTEFQPDYTGGLAFAIAKNEKEARKMVQKEYGECNILVWGKLEIRELDIPVARCVFGGA